MARFSYTGSVSFKQVLQADFQQRFDDLADKANAQKHDLDQMRANACRYRHFRVPPNIYGRSELQGTALWAGVLDKGGVNWNWTNAVVAHLQVATSAFNGIQAAQPTIHVHASYISHEWEYSAYEIGIGYSTDGGVSYTRWQYSPRIVGYTQAHVNPLWSAKTTHYHTGVLASWWSKTMYGKREPHTTVAAVNNSYGVDISTITHWALGIRVNSGRVSGAGTKDVHELDVGKIWLMARDNS